MSNKKPAKKKKFTLQQAFSKIWTHFIIDKNPPSWDEKLGSCAMVDEDGNRCAVGCLLPKKVWVENGLDGADSEDKKVVRLFKKSGADSHLIENLRHFQAMHDDAATWGGKTSAKFRPVFKEKMQAFARNSGLTIPKSK